MIRGQNDSGVWQSFEYDAAGRQTVMKDDAGNPIETYTYGPSRNRLINETSAGRTYYAWGGSSVVAEYVETGAGTSPDYDKSYIYAGSRLLMTATKATSTTETQEFHHPDRLGTQLVTNGSTGSSYRQTTFPFGTTISAETTGNSNQVFTSYDRSASTGLDYAINRTYSPGQARFTQVDPLGLGSTSPEPQSMNLYSYVQNIPTDFVDPMGLNLAGPGSHYGTLDPMGVAYYVDGMLSDARTAWSIIGAGAGWIDYENVAAIDVVTFGSWVNDEWIRDHQYIFFEPNWDEERRVDSTDGVCPKNIFGVADPACLLKEATKRWPAIRKCLKAAHDRAAKALTDLRSRFPFDGRWSSEVGVAAAGGAYLGKPSPHGMLIGGIVVGGTAAYGRVSERTAGWFRTLSAWETDVGDCFGTDFVNTQGPGHYRFPPELDFPL